MQDRQQKLIESFQRVQAFLATHESPGAAGLAEAKAILDAAVEELLDHSSAQLFGRQLSKAERMRVKARMKRLRGQHMLPITAIAKLRADRLPGLADELKMPVGGLGAGRLVHAARAMRNAAAQHVPLFVEAGRPADFLAQLDAAIASIEQALGGHALNIGTKVGANAGLKDQLRRARRAVDLLDPLVKTAFEGNAVVLARWQAAKRVKGGAAFASPDGSAEPEITPAIAPTVGERTAA